MHYGVVMTSGDAAAVAELAQAAERSGWDAIFTWEPVWGIDAWVCLTAAAMRTSTIRLGTMLTPLPRRKPWDVATTTATLDRLSGGRVILSVGLGALHEGWTAFERDEGRRTRAEQLDEGLDVLFGLWRGQPFSYQGKHFQVQPTTFMVPPPPVQQPRITTWCVGLAGSRRSMARAARCDGLLPNFRGDGGRVAEGAHPLARWEQAVTEIRALRTELGLTGPYDVVYEAATDWADPAAARQLVRDVQGIGATWYLDADWSAATGDPIAALRERIEHGPPRI
jgi:alkanesulfonate monooxygenase SsuD/methylene tetrahydromethanopterin reductase-like flavin-dependent oxidoreductase (luciferase family)